MEYEVYLLARPVTLNYLKGAMRAAIKNFNNLYYKISGTKSNVVSLCAEQQLEQVMDFIGCELLLTRICVQFFAPITIVPIIQVITLY
jgi:hypothetical protein